MSSYSPYINTQLDSIIDLHPSQMDNKIYINLKKNLEKKIVGKCFRNYGYISEIYEIINYKNGIIRPENFTASSTFDVTFSCRLCLPLENRKIICQVDRVNKVLVTVKNGPITIIITKERINDKVFFSDNNNNLRYRKDNKSYLLKSSEFVIVTITKTAFNNGDTIIRAIGFMENIATDDDIKLFYKELYNKDGDLINIDQYLTSENIENDNKNDKNNENDKTNVQLNNNNNKTKTN